MSVLLVILGLVAGVAFMVLKALVVDQAKGHIQRYLRASLEATIDALPAEVQAGWAEEWRADLAMHSSMPVTALRFVRGVRRSARKLIGDPALAPVSFRQRTRSRVIPPWLPQVSQRLRAALERPISPSTRRVMDIVQFAAAPLAGGACGVAMTRSDIVIVGTAGVIIAFAIAVVAFAVPRRGR